MESWNLIGLGPTDLQLINKSKTAVRLSRRVKPDLARLMGRMEELGVPLAYTEGVNEIYFTNLPGETDGDHLDGFIRISCRNQSQDEMDKTLIHELAHHLDEQEFISIRDPIMEEKKKKARFITDTYAKKSCAEYVAVGFEIFYAGSEKERKALCRHNSKLFNIIKQIHRKYRGK